ncbi:MAG: hypothetical protein QM501_06695 [Gimesia sp.]
MTDKIPVVLSLLIMCLINTACSSTPSDQPELAEVTGVVTLDNKPLEGVLVQFSPAEGRGSQSMTDSEGNYDLTYVYPTKGAKIGEHKVTIETPPVDDSDPDAPKVKELVPAKYRVDSTLTADVKAEDNQINFHLTSK